MRVWSVLLVSVVTLGGCDDSCDHPVDPSSIPPDPYEGYDATGCVPDEATWTTDIEPRIEANCDSCHGDPLSGGAPFSLLDYDDLVSGTPGTRKVDRMGFRVSNGTMPPPPASLSSADQSAIVSWATCGRVTATDELGLKVDRDPYDAAGPDVTKLPSFDLLAKSFAVTPAEDNSYECWAMDVPVTKARHIVRMQVVLDDARVVHHVVLMHDPDRVTADEDGAFSCGDFPHSDTPAIYAWAPGGNAFAFDDGGLRVEPGDRVILQVHYHNDSGITDAVDNSGIRMFLDQATGTDWTMRMFGPTDFTLPADSWSQVCTYTKVTSPMRFLAGMPHMHELGAEFHQDIVHRDGSRTPVVNLTGWDFDVQQFYRYDLTMDRGDTLDTWCVYDNDTPKEAVYGEKTEDEMCFHFSYVAKGL